MMLCFYVVGLQYADEKEVNLVPVKLRTKISTFLRLTLMIPGDEGEPRG